MKAIQSCLSAPDAKKKRGGGRPLEIDRDKTLTATKPWAKLNMSKATWYRRGKPEASND